MNSSHLSLGIVQENPIVGDIKGNLNLAKKTIERILSKEKVDLILFTEMFITGYPPEDLILRDDLLAAVETALVGLSKISPDTHIVVGYPKKIDKISITLLEFCTTTKSCSNITSKNYLITKFLTKKDILALAEAQEYLK